MLEDEPDLLPLLAQGRLRGGHASTVRCDAIAHGLTGDQQVAVVDALEAVHRAQERGLAGARGTDEHDDLARLHVQRDVIEHPAPAEFARNVLRADEGIGHFRTPESERAVTGVRGADRRPPNSRCHGDAVVTMPTRALSFFSIALWMIVQIVVRAR